MKLSGTGTSATSLFVDNGANNAGGIYSYGTTGANPPERALGSLASGGTTPAFGVSLTNTTGSNITSLLISYKGEQWRSSTTTQNVLAFSYQIGATDLTSGTWTPFTALNFTGAPAVAANGALNGNTNPTSISSTITGLNIANNQQFWLRWVDTENTGNDAGLAIDDFTITSGGSDTTAPTIATLSPADDATAVVVGNNLQVTFNENIQKGTGNIVIKQSSDNAVVETIAVTSAQVTVSGSTVTINPTNDLIAGTGYYVEISAGAIKDTAGNNFAGITGSTAWNFTTASAGGTPTLSYSTSTLNEARAFDGSINDKIIITLTGSDSFTGSNGDNLITGSKATITQRTHWTYRRPDPHQHHHSRT
ncbi:MAG: Ig-like domain-containing protein [Pseudanabaena sp. ELA607]